VVDGGRGRTVGWAVGILLVIAFTTWALVRGWRGIGEYDWKLSIGWLVLGIVLVVTALVATGTGYWLLICRLQPESQPPMLATLSIWARSLLGRYVPGSILMFVGRLELGRGIGIARRTSLAASLYEQIFGPALAAVAAIFFVATGVGGSQGLWAAVLLPFLLVLLHPKILGSWSRWALAKVKRPPLHVLLTGRQVWGFAGWYAVTTLLMSAGVWALIHAAAPSSGSVFTVGGAYQLSVVLGTLALFIPAGLGVREVALALALAPRVGTDVANVLAIGLRFALTALEVAVVGTVVFVAARRR
jgi:glycosyltransferase 2 family protein